jgi:ubiquitin-protein ligase E3 A
LELDGEGSFHDASEEELNDFLMRHSSPNEIDCLPYLKAALILLLLQPKIRRTRTTSTSTNPSINSNISTNPSINSKTSNTINSINSNTSNKRIRSLALQILGRCIRRSNRAKIKTIPVTVPLLLGHFADAKFIGEIIIADLHADLDDRFAKIPDLDALGVDALTGNLLIVFDYIYLVNEAFQAVSFSGHVAAELFYHPFPGHFDVCEDYAKWRVLALKDQHSNTRPPLPFVFCDYPWILGLDLKRILLGASNQLKQRHHLQDSFFRALFDGVQSTHLVLHIRRQHLIQDAMDQLIGKPLHHLAKQIKIVFDGEQGVDEGGLKKEFFQLCWEKLFEGVDDALFKPIDETTFWFKHNYIRSDKIALADTTKFTFIGTLLALAIYNGVLVAPKFPLLLFKRLLKWPLQLSDYTEIDHGLVHSLNNLLSSDTCDLGITFTVPGSDESVELVTGGSNVLVTSGNVANYVHLLTNFLLYDSYAEQFKALQTGFEQISLGSVIYGFRPQELAALAYGSQEFKLQDLQLIANYDGGFAPDSPQVTWLWELLFLHFNHQNRIKFLAFVTGSERAPVGGLKALKTFTITRVPTNDSGRLPSAHTCFNCLLLPEYETFEILQEKLLLAIQHNRGFGLI